MKDEAITKINEEMQKDPNDTFLEAVGQHLIDRCGQSDLAASAFLASGRTLKEFCDTIRNKARAKAQNEARAKARDALVVIEDQIVFDQAEEYFGMEKDGSVEAPAQSVPAGGLAISFEDFI